MSCGGLWLAVTITPATHPSSRIANARIGVGSGLGITSALRPAPVITSAVSRAKTSELCRASYPITTSAPDGAPWSFRYAARPAAARATTTRFIRLGPRRAHPGDPRSELQRAVEAVRQLGLVAGRDERLELGLGERVGVLGCPALGAGDQRVQEVTHAARLVVTARPLHSVRREGSRRVRLARPRRLPGHEPERPVVADLAQQRPPARVKGPQGPFQGGLGGDLGGGSV